MCQAFFWTSLIFYVQLIFLKPLNALKIFQQIPISPLKKSLLFGFERSVMLDLYSSHWLFNWFLRTIKEKKYDCFLLRWNVNVSLASVVMLFNPIKYLSEWCMKKYPQTIFKLKPSIQLPYKAFPCNIQYLGIAVVSW